MRWAAGIDLGGTNVKAVAVTADGEVVARRRVPTRDGIDSPRDWARTASRAIEAFSHACGGAPTAAGVVVGMPGSIEGMIGECTLRARTGNRFSTTHDLVATYGAGDPDATKIWLRSIRALAVAMASSINMLDPEIVLVAGGMSQAGAALFVPLAAELDRVEWRPNGRRVPIEPAALGEWAGAIGAARNALLS